MKIPFTKMQGLGNDFVVIDSFRDPSFTTATITPELARQIGDRHFGVGFDQLLIIGPSTKADARMDILDNDGTVAEMCGNGVRAAALYLRTRVGKKAETLRIETLAGIKTVQVRAPHPGAQAMQFSVDMGAPGMRPEAFAAGEKLKLPKSGTEVSFFEVNMGNPHAVVLVPDLAGLPLAAWGPEIEKNPRFAHRTNVEFVQVMDRTRVRVVVWERGAGFTLACGTGACAAAVTVIQKGLTQPAIEVEMPGGVLRVAWGGVGQPVLMEGPAAFVFEGVMEV